MRRLLGRPQERKDIQCRLCRKLEQDTKSTIHVKEWLAEIQEAPCPYCRAMLRAFDSFDPSFREKLSLPSAKLNIITNHHRLRYFFSEVIDARPEVHRIKDISFFAPDAPESGLLLATSATSQVPGDEQTWKFIQRCFEICDRWHATCWDRQDPGWYPKRLLQLEKTACGEPLVRLVETQDELSRGPYIALSHCWGSIQPIRTTSATITQFKKCIDFAHLPRTFQDCVTVALKLDICYIWIDSLCIVQDSIDDWAEQSGVMHRIFYNARVTVAAVASRDGRIPFLGPDAPNRRSLYPTVELATGGIPGIPSTIAAKRVRPELAPHVFEGPLEERGWTWQERYLSTRTINFTDCELKWSCLSLSTCECPDSATFASPNVLRDSHTHTLKQWARLVEDYSQRVLSFPSDKLPAISGAAAQFAKELRSPYLAGLWTSDFPTCLAWFPPRRVGNAGERVLPATAIPAPSWSWASVLGKVVSITRTYPWKNARRYQANNHNTIFLAELIEAKCEPTVASNPFGQVQVGSYLVMKGKVIEGILECDCFGAAVFTSDLTGQLAVQSDCSLVSRTVRSADGRASSVISRANEEEDGLLLSQEQSVRGTVLCLLLASQTRDSSDQIIVCAVILGRVVGDMSFQKLGVGVIEVYSRTDMDFNGFWGRWPDLEGWQFSEARWKTIISHAHTKNLKIV